MVDILLSTYNGEKFLKAQLDSLFSQTYQNFKIIIRDDCSLDNTYAIIESYKEKNLDKIHIIPNKGINLGSSNSFFELLKNSTSNLIMFCDQDDVWKSNKIENTVNFYYSVNNIDQPILIHTAVEIVDEYLKPLPKLTKDFNKYKYSMEKKMIWQVFQNDVTGCTVLINDKMRDVVNKIDYRQLSVIQHDWLLAQIAFYYNSKFFFPEKTMFYRQHSSNVLGAKHLSFFKRVSLKIKNGCTYPFYDHIASLCQILDIENDKLKTFAELKNKKKLYRIYWHLINRFFMKGFILKKIYQLFVC